MKSADEMKSFSGRGLREQRKKNGFGKNNDKLNKSRKWEFPALRLLWYHELKDISTTFPLVTLMHRPNPFMLLMVDMKADFEQYSLGASPPEK